MHAPYRLLVKNAQIALQNSQNPWKIFSFYSPILLFEGPPPRLHPFVIQCKGCRECVPAPVETLPDAWIAMKCPLCGEYRRYLATEIFQGRLSWKLVRKPVQTADGRQ